jgi:hypothetical protein
VPRQVAPFFESIGRFIAAYALAEAGVHQVARKLSGLSDEKARTIFGQMRFGDLCECVRRMAKVDQLRSDVFAEVDDCLTQIKLVSARRHKLVHRYVTYQDGNISVTNALTAKFYSSFEVEVFSIDDLVAMSDDCTRAYVHIARVVAPEEYRNACTSLGVVPPGLRQTKHSTEPGKPWRAGRNL